MNDWLLVLILSLVTISAGVTNYLISKMKEGAMQDTVEVGWLVSEVGALYTSVGLRVRERVHFISDNL